MEDPQIINPGTSIATPKVIIMMADYGHDPTETAVPWAAFKTAGYEISIATQNSQVPRCDNKMLQGVTQKLLSHQKQGATKDVVAKYKQMQQSEEMLHPLSWSAPDFSLDPYDLVLFPGGHEKSVRQVIESPTVHKLMLDYFPKTKKPSHKVVAAVCHGVMVLSESKDANGRSIIHDCVTTALPTRFEKTAYWGTRAFLGDYYKTFGHGSENVQESVTKALASPAQFKSSLNPGPFVVEDENYNYISARYPGDAVLFAEEIIKLFESFHKLV
ncbi:class I glutamine amidotransferase-like protein [Xylaria bambusicola]|uniref:class I glutamine amidotransferase-like protein n=1 Tax=Xylaria bambusicola TaxID=326684 RepID=UPI002008D084|nr:class I glutamine amidotransferase-like protein [Xylaria bambusicola]KAI0505416.1 class I glutamine amidotransferase-like protein [Xylaria bambusicola]